MEQVILNSLKRYTKTNGYFRTQWSAFQQTSLCRTMLRLNYDVIDGARSSPLDTRAILCVGLTKDFDNVKHSAILTNLSKLGVGTISYDNISNFLEDRKAPSL